MFQTPNSAFQDEGHGSKTRNGKRRARRLRGARNGELSSPPRVTGATIVEFRDRATWLARVLASVPRRARKSIRPAAPEDVARDAVAMPEAVKVKEARSVASAPSLPDRPAVASEEEALAWFEEVMKEFERRRRTAGAATVEDDGAPGET